MGAHLIDNEFQSDKYPTTPRGKVPLSVRDPMAQELLWEYAQRRRSVDAEFAADLEAALLVAGFDPDTNWTVDPTTHRSNSSERFLSIVDEVDSVIRSSGFDLLNGRAESVARLIVARFAHFHMMTPPRAEERMAHQIAKQYERTALRWRTNVLAMIKGLKK